MVSAAAASNRFQRLSRLHASSADEQQTSASALHPQRDASFSAALLPSRLSIDVIGLDGSFVKRQNHIGTAGGGSAIPPGDEAFLEAIQRRTRLPQDLPDICAADCLPGNLQEIFGPGPLQGQARQRPAYLLSLAVAPTAAQTS